MDLGLEGRRALVTGGSRGIGKAIARQLALEGAHVAIAARDGARLAAAAAELSAEAGRPVVGVAVDTGEAAAVTAMAGAVLEALGGVDILVNAAARPAGQTPAPRWDAVGEDDLFDEVRVKVLGYLRVAQAVVPSMQKTGWGRIINISGLAARQASSVVGSIRNVAVAALTKNLADELAGTGINVVTVHPGMTVTEAMSDERRALPSRNLVGRYIEASEVADLVAFLASPRSVAVNGDVIAAGGGSPGAIFY